MKATILSVLVFFLFYENTYGVYFLTSPSDSCVTNGQSVEFSCSARFFLSSDAPDVAALQEWVIRPVSGTPITFDTGSTAFPPPDPPPGYEFIVDLNAQLVNGIRVVSADSSLNNATFQCIGFFGAEQNSSAPAARLEVAGPPDQLSCSVSCPPVYVTGVSDNCILEWTRPQTASCASLSYMTEVLEPFQSYTATVTVISSCGSSSQCSESFMSPKEERPSAFDVELPFIANDKVIITAKYPVDSPTGKFSVVITDDNDQEILRQSFSGNSSSLSLDISSLQQCMSYTVSVTATNTGGSRTASAMLSGSQTRREQEGVEMSENVSYGPVKQNTIPIASSGGSTAVPEYEELSDIHQRGVELETGAHLETGGSGSKVEYEDVESPRV